MAEFLNVSQAGDPVTEPLLGVDEVAVPADRRGPVLLRVVGTQPRAAKIAADWVAGVSIKSIAERYFGDAANPTAALTEATKAIYRNLATAGTWGITALSKLPTSGIDFENVSESDLRSINLLGAMLYHGANTEAGVVMRMSSVPRTAANSLGAEFAQGHEAGSLRPSEAREFLSQLSDADWGRHVPRGSDLAGSDLRDLWQVLSGSTGNPGARSGVGAAEQPRSGSS